MFRLQPEQWILVAILVICGGLLAFKAASMPDGLEAAMGGGKVPPKVDVRKMDDTASRFEKPAQIPTSEHKVYASRLIVFYPSDGAIKPLDPAATGPDGIQIQWKMDNGFALDDAALAAADPDSDGFSNLEEFKAGTSPKDKASHPPFIEKLRVASYNFVPFRMVFKGYNPDATTGELTFQINLLDVDKNRTRMVKAGDEVEGYKIGEFRKNIVERYNEKTKVTEKRDESELDLTDMKLNETVKMIFNKTTESDNSTVELKLEVPGLQPEPQQVKRGGIFKIEGQSYQLIKAGQNSATIRDVGDKKLYEIGPDGAKEVPVN